MARKPNIAAVKGAKPANDVAWIEPDVADLFTQTLPAPAFPTTALPEKLRGVVESVATARCINFDLMASTMLATVSGAIGNRVRLELTPVRAEPLTEFMVLVTEPGEGKSEAIGVGREALNRTEQASASTAGGQDPVLGEVERTRNRNARKAVASRGGVIVEDAVGARGARLHRLVVTDATVAGIRDALLDRPEGGMVVADELIGSIGMSTGADAAKTRSLVLEAFDGNPYAFVSAKHGELLVPALQLTVLGGTQPDRVDLLVGKAVDGLASRFLWCAPNVEPIDGMAESDGELEMFVGALRRLAAIEPARLPGAFPAVIRISAEARAVFETANKGWNARRELASPLSKSLLARARTHSVRLAGLMALAERALAGGELPGGPISGEEAARGVELVDSYYLVMGERATGELRTHSRATPAIELARYLVRLRKPNVNARTDIRKGIASPLRDPKVILDAFEELRVQGYVRKVPHTGPGRPADIFEVNPHLLG